MERTETRWHERGAGNFDELVFSVRSVSAWSRYDRLWYAWDEAQTEAELAYEAWCAEPGPEAYVVYRAGQDRADAAQDALARYADRSGKPELPAG
jgi:hypothetical protein